VLDAVAAIAAEAGRLALGRASGEYKRWEKAPGHPVCDVDLAVDAFLRERLAKLIPDAGWLSEETVDEPSRLGKRQVWIVDPIDGTRDFLRGRSGWCVSVALVEDGSPIVGVLDAPARSEVWAAQKGEGATRNGVAISASQRAALSGARMPIDALPKVDRDLVAVAKPNSIALRICMVAAGEADLVATYKWGHQWDLAAAALVASEAGAAVSDAVGRPLAFNTPGAAVFGVLACVPAIQVAALARFGERARAAL